MPKVKTNRAAAKRFKKTASGKFKYGKANRRHILTKKSSKRKRHLRAGGFIDSANHHEITRLLPNG